MRSEAQTRLLGKSHRRGELYDEEGFEPQIKHRAAVGTVDEWAMKLLEQELVASTTVVETEGDRKGIVVSVARRVCEVQTPTGRETVALTADMAGRQKTDLAVGDDVLFTTRGDVSILRGVLPRRTRLSRPDPGSGNVERVVVANVDVIVVVVSVVSPPLHPRLIDRYLIAIGRGGAQPVICVNKLDLLNGNVDQELEKLRPYEALGVPVVKASATARNGLDELRETLQGKLGAFVGHSGVGKSSLLNALKPELDLNVGDVSEGYGRGTHTTTASTLWDMGDGTRIIDTPGVRSFGLWDLKKEELPWFFPEFTALRCRFNDCQHIHEPNCAVRDAVDSGEVSRDRYETYKRILGTLGR